MTRSTPPWRPWGDHPIIVAILVIAALIGVVVAVLPFVSTERSVTYSGRVRNNTTETPIHVAKVTLEFGGRQYIDYSDGEGYFRFSSIPASQTGEANIRAEANGYKAYDRKITITSNTLQLEEIRLIPDVAVTSPPPPSEEAASVPATATSPMEPSRAPNVTPQPTMTAQPITQATTSPIPPITSSRIITDTFDTDQLNTNLWQPPSDPTIVFINEGVLHFQVTQQQVVNGTSATLALSPQIDPIRSIDFTMTMISFDRMGQGGVGGRAFMSDGPDHYISLTHDATNAAMELGTCKSKSCGGNYNDYYHADAVLVQEGQPVQMRIRWEDNSIALYVDDVKRAVAPAQDTPIKDFRFSLFATPGGVFEVTVDDVIVTYTTP